jgi:hypothetical protein
MQSVCTVLSLSAGLTFACISKGIQSDSSPAVAVKPTLMPCLSGCSFPYQSTPVLLLWRPKPTNQVKHGKRSTGASGLDSVDPKGLAVSIRETYTTVAASVKALSQDYCAKPNKVVTVDLELDDAAEDGGGAAAGGGGAAVDDVYAAEKVSVLSCCLSVFEV